MPNPANTVTRDELIAQGLISAPCAPTLSERRAIFDALEAAYDIPRERYHGQDSDHTIAERLNYPRAWVRDIRIGFFGARNENESAAEMLATMGELEKELKALQGRAGQLEGKLNALKASVEKLNKGAA